MSTELSEFMRAQGYAVDNVVPDGQIHRFRISQSDKKESGWYIAYENRTQKGVPFQVVLASDWSRMGDPIKHHTLKGRLSKEDRAYVNDQMKAAVDKAMASKRAEWEETARLLNDMWPELLEVGDSSYLSRKKIQKTGLGIRYSEKNEIFIPISDTDGKMWSWQRIKEDGEKRFYPKGKVQSCFHSLGSDKAERIYIAEGFATIASIFMATGGKHFYVCAFNSGNLGPAALSIFEKYPDKKIIICGDDDRFKDPNKNPGRIAAETASLAVNGFVVFPRFSTSDGAPTDWNDLHVREGLEVVTAQLDAEKKKERARMIVYPLGFREKEYFFTSSENRQICAVCQFSEKDFLDLLPLSYWTAHYPAEKAVANWSQAKSDLMDACRRKGIFEGHKVRGAGVWMDEGRVVVNMGDHLIVDGRRSDLGAIKTRYFYRLCTKLPELSPNPLTLHECEVVRSATEAMSWKQKDSACLLAGAMVTTRLCGALPIRPHLWVTGSRGSGKTTVFQRFIYPLIGQPLIYAAGNSSEAGIRQAVSANAIPVLFDEFENNGERSQATIQAILDLMRLSWSETGAQIIKGGSSGNSVSYEARFAGIVSSIRQVSMNDADRSRFATLDLDEHSQQDAGQWDYLQSLFAEINEDFGARLFARSVRMLPIVLENFRIMKKELMKQAPGQRFADQYGMLLAGYGALISDSVLTSKEASDLAARVTLQEERDRFKILDHDDALQHLLTKKISFEERNIRKEKLVGDLIGEALKNEPHAVAALHQIGVKVDSLEIAIVGRNHAELESQVFRGTQWSKIWGASLARLPGAEKNKSKWIGGRNQKCVTIPTHLLS